MKASKITSGHSLYWLAFLLALSLRLFQLGAAPLSDYEAGWALQALGLARGSIQVLGAQPAYILLSSLLFSIFGDTNFLARLFPALAGSLIVWLPYIFRRWAGDSHWLQRAGIVMAFGLAIDPGLVSVSRQAGSLMSALAFSLLALACLYNRHMIWAGICAGLALLSGLAFLQGALILAISWGLFTLVGWRFTQSQPGDNIEEPQSRSAAPGSTRAGVLACLLTILFIGTLFLRAPQGLGALADTVPAYFKAWVSSSGIPVLRLPASLLVYQPLALIFALIGAIRVLFGHWEDESARRVMVGFVIWAAVALLLPLVYAGRQVGDMAWALIPLWALAAVEISRSLLGSEDKVTHLVAAGLGSLLFILAVMGWFELLYLGRPQVSVAPYSVILIGVFLLGFIAILLAATGWSSTSARLGVVWSLCLIFGLQLLSNTWGTAITHQNGAVELWSPPPATGQADLLLATLTDFSTWNTGLRDQLEIEAMVDSPSLHWALRDFPNARFVSSLSTTASPPVVITPKDAAEPQLTQQYRGQDFVWQLYPGWQGILPGNFINWLAFRQAPLGQVQIIVWARSDIFPGGSSDTTGRTLP